MIRLFPIRFSKDQVRDVPKQSLLYYLLLSQAANEIIIFRKLGLVALTGQTGDGPETIGATAITHLMLRMSAGRLHEGQTLLGDAMFRDVRSEIHPIMEERSRAAVKKITRYFGGANIVSQLRNQSAFHLAPTRAAAALDELEDDFELVDYLSAARGNCLYASGAVVSALELAMIGGQGATGDSLDKVFEEVRSITALFEEYAEGFIAAFAEKYLGMTGDSLRAAEVNLRAPDIRTFQLPYFLDDSFVTADYLPE